MSGRSAYEQMTEEHFSKLLRDEPEWAKQMAIVRKDRAGGRCGVSRPAMIRDVAALYVDRGGPYPKLVEHWYDEARDARKYDGPWPVVAHPPCGPWGAFAHLCKTSAQDPALALRALDQVRSFGGVLEHPRNSRLYTHACLPKPGELPDSFGGFSIDVDQLHWGHVAHKRTWLYLVGIRAEDITTPPEPDRRPTHDLMGGRGRNAGAQRSGRLEASKELRRRTPLAFAQWLLSLADDASRF